VRTSTVSFHRAGPGCRLARGICLCACVFAVLTGAVACTPIAHPWAGLHWPAAVVPQTSDTAPGFAQSPKTSDPADQQSGHRTASREAAPGGEQSSGPECRTIADRRDARSPRAASDSRLATHATDDVTNNLEVLRRAEWILSAEALAAAERIDLLRRPAHRQPDWKAALRDSNPVARANAAIALARLGDPQVIEHLAAAAGDPALPLPVRCASAEAMGELPAGAAVGLLRELCDQYADYPRPDQQPEAPYLPELHAELLRALGKHALPEDEDRLLEALGSPSAQVRLEALRAWMIRCRPRGTLPGTTEQTAGAEFASGKQPLWASCELPPEVIDQRSHGDWRVRAAALRVIGLARPPRAFEYVESGLQDFDWRVRVAAIEALALLGDEPARARLADLLGDRSERIRAAAVAALAKTGDREKVFEAAEDQSWRVRRAVAEALARWPGEKSAVLARRLLADPSAEVQVAVVEAVGQWPLEHSAPLLLEAMDRPSLMTRQAATRCLARKWPEAAQFVPEAPAQRRRELIEQLRSRLSADLPAIDSAAPYARRPAAGANSEGPQQTSGIDRGDSSSARRAEVDSALVDAVEHSLAGGEIASLGRYGAGLLPALEKIVLERGRPLPEAVYQQVLPRLDPSFAALAQLAQGGLRERRRAASQLAALAQTGPISRLAAERLVQLVVPEQDVLVWHDALSAVRAAPGEDAIRLAYAGLSHPEPEVRRLACELLAERPDPRHLKLLAPALEDRHPAVRLAATGAWGLSARSAHVTAAHALRRLAARGSAEERLSAAVAMAQAGDPAGKAALERLCFHPDPEIRRRVAQQMGELADPEFAPSLVRLLDDQLSVARAALESLPKVVGRDVAARQEDPPPDTAERMRRWREWFRQQGAGRFKAGLKAAAGVASEYHGTDAGRY